MQDAIFAWIDAAKEAGRSIPKATLSKPPEWARPSPPSEASRDERDAIRKEAFEEAAKVAKDHLEKWADDLTDTCYAYRDAMASGKFNGRAISRDLAKAGAKVFSERAGAVLESAEHTATAIRARVDSPPPGK